jgi:hypothetical protein
LKPGAFKLWVNWIQAVGKNQFNLYSPTIANVIVGPRPMTSAERPARGDTKVDRTQTRANPVVMERSSSPAL